MHKAIIAHKNSAIKKQVLTQGLMSKRIAPSVAYNKKQKNQTNENLIVMFDCQTMDSPIGQLVLISYQDKLVALVFADAVKSIKSYLIKQAPLLVDGQKNKNVKSEIQVLFTTKNSKVLSQAKKQLRQYFARQRTQFQIPLLLLGTEFQKSVWQALDQIPFGKTISYQSQAQAIKKTNAVRAVGRTNGLNPICIILPCHRVIGKSGKLTGYAGGLHIKEFLLNHEGKC